MRKFFLFTKYLRTNSIKKQFFNVKNILQKLQRLKSALKLTITNCLLSVLRKSICQRTFLNEKLSTLMLKVLFKKKSPLANIC